MVVSQSQTITVDQPLLRVGCVLGEGTSHASPIVISMKRQKAPLYDPGTSTLHFVDIEAKKV
jgi:hypothetical protein